MTTSAVLFDMDGVLVDSASLHVRAYERIFHDAGIEFPAAARDAVREGKRRAEVIEIAAPDASSAVGQALFDAKPAAVAQLLRDDANVSMPGATRLVRALADRGIPMGVVTNSVDPDLWLAAAEILDVMDVVITGNEVSSTKPAPEGYLLAAERLRVHPTACIVFEDSRDGWLAASRAGMRVLVLASARPAWADESVELVPGMDSSGVLALCLPGTTGEAS
ncbi:MAG: HAD-IA family hydrolase [Deltaproteobacteria bacterium]|nr:HAD-IA family hydrolase [Deltaproteobacteria bacterium]NND27705.1 HAD-IA family hydrolase [Myxococcales bacterium]MBT8466205.1 HAD-IA family hydrolase [Deltaproteobacteria bacterium]MBT8480013.1 HAD-IA family hydrolase [Deltaproteobacteria bacterium]NNK06658.1 HAD-IA family hydrolase [Myxococcales bacterium]